MQSYTLIPELITLCTGKSLNHFVKPYMI